MSHPWWTAFFVGWSLMSLFAFAGMQGRAANAAAKRPSASVPSLVAIAAAIGLLWIPIGIAIGVKLMIRRRTVHEFESMKKKFEEADAGAVMRKKFESNARAEVARLQKEARR